MRFGILLEMSLSGVVESIELNVSEGFLLELGMSWCG